MNENKNTFAYKIGRFVGCVLAACVCASIVGVTIAGTIKLYMWLF